LINSSQKRSVLILTDDERKGERATLDEIGRIGLGSHKQNEATNHPMGGEMEGDE
jgi:hypothetical protein